VIHTRVISLFTSREHSKDDMRFLTQSMITFYIYRCAFSSYIHASFHAFTLFGRESHAFFAAKRSIIHRVFKLSFASSSSGREPKGSTRRSIIAAFCRAFCGDSEIRAWFAYQMISNNDPKCESCSRCHAAHRELDRCPETRSEVHSDTMK